MLCLYMCSNNAVIACSTTRNNSNNNNKQPMTTTNNNQPTSDMIMLPVFAMTRGWHDERKLKKEVLPKWPSRGYIISPAVVTIFSVFSCFTSVLITVSYHPQHMMSSKHAFFLHGMHVKKIIHHTKHIILR